MRLALRITGLLLVLACVAAAAFYAYLRGSLPKVEGELLLSGLGAPVEILRDSHGIPDIYARSALDAHYALGFAHAQDRLWQMEVNRRIGAGRLAELVGAPALETDRFMRTLGVRRAAAENLKRYDAETRRLLDAYAAGVNAYLATGPVLPPEFWRLGAPRPEPWTPLDSVAWTKMMAWDLGGNWRNELLRLRLARALPTSRIQEFFAPYPGDPPVRLPELKNFYGGLERPAVEIASRNSGSERSEPEFSSHFANSGSDPEFPVDGLGSNAWVLSGSRTASGKPLLANDPHLGLTAPPVWYFAHLSAPGLEVIGATLPGVPGVVVGRTDRFAWGFTNTGPDVQDLYLERIDAAGRYLAPDGPRGFQVLDE
jgi:penicillin amidase